MGNIVKRGLSLISLLLYTSIIPFYAIESLADNTLPQESLSIHFKNNEGYLSFVDWINARSYTIEMDEKLEGQKIREDWKNFFKIDIFSPYFKAHEIKDKTEEKSTTRILNLQGKAHLNEDEVKYIFSIKF